MIRKQLWRTESERAEKLRKEYDSYFKDHVILEEHIISPSKATFSIGKPNDSFYYAEISMLGYGTILVHGDVAPCIFGGAAARTWKGKLNWLSDANYDYAWEKARIGFRDGDATASEYDADCCIAQVLEAENNNYIHHEDVLAIINYIEDGDFRMAGEKFYFSSRRELYLDTSVASRVIMAQSCITKLCNLLEAQEQLKEPPFWMDPEEFENIVKQSRLADDDPNKND